MESDLVAEILDAIAVVLEEDRRSADGVRGEAAAAAAMIRWEEGATSLRTAAGPLGVDPADCRKALTVSGAKNEVGR